MLKNGYFKIIKVEISFLKNNQYSDQNFNQINNLMNETEYSFFGFSNAHYQDNKILFFDAFYINNNLLSWKILMNKIKNFISEVAYVSKLTRVNKKKFRTIISVILSNITVALDILIIVILK